MTEQQFSKFFILTKVDEQLRTVYGRAAAEEPDHSREVMDYASSKPLFEQWSAGAQKRSGGKSKGNVREMHSPIAAGKVIELNFNDDEKAIDIGTYCSDDSTWQKILDGTLTGFSIGGKYDRRWPDTRTGLMRYTAIPQEISYVDSPAMPSATFTFIKSDGSQEIRKVATPTVPDVPTVTEETKDGTVDVSLEMVDEHDLDPKVIPDSGGAPSPDLITDNSTPADGPSAVPFQKVLEQLTMVVEKLVSQQEAADVERQQHETILKALGARVGIARRDGAPLTVSSDPDAYGDPANGLWPYGNAADCQSAVAEFNLGKRKGTYSDREWHVLGRRIANRASTQFGNRHQYIPQEKRIKSEVKMTELKKDDASSLINQIQAGLSVAVDQLGTNPAAAKDMLMALIGSLDSSVNPTPVNTSTSDPVAPQGGAQGDGMGKADGSVQPPMTMADTPVTPPVAPPPVAEKTDVPIGDQPDAYKDLSTRVDSLTEMVGKLCAKLMPEGGIEKQDEPPADDPAVEKRAPIGDLAALLKNAAQPTVDPVIEALLSGEKNALIKAASLAGSPERPDVEAVMKKAQQASIDMLTPIFTQMMFAQGFGIPSNLGTTQG